MKLTIPSRIFLIFRKSAYSTGAPLRIYHYFKIYSNNRILKYFWLFVNTILQRALVFLTRRIFHNDILIVTLLPPPHTRPNDYIAMTKIGKINFFKLIKNIFKVLSINQSTMHHNNLFRYRDTLAYKCA